MTKTLQSQHQSHGGGGGVTHPGETVHRTIIRTASCDSEGWIENGLQLFVSGLHTANVKAELDCGGSCCTHLDQDAPTLNTVEHVLQLSKAVQQRVLFFILYRDTDTSANQGEFSGDAGLNLGQ